MSAGTPGWSRDAISSRQKQRCAQLAQAIDPIPAYVRNARLDILAWNDAIADPFVDYGSLLPHERNTLRLRFLYVPYRPRILDWEDMARGMAQDQVPFDSLVEELSDQSPEFRAWLQDTDVKGFDEGRKRLLHPNRGALDFTYVALTPEGRPDLSLVTHLPHQAAGDRSHRIRTRLLRVERCACTGVR